MFADIRYIHHQRRFNHLSSSSRLNNPVCCCCTENNDSVSWRAKAATSSLKQTLKRLLLETGTIYSNIAQIYETIILKTIIKLKESWTNSVTDMYCDCISIVSVKPAVFDHFHNNTAFKVTQTLLTCG